MNDQASHGTSAGGETEMPHGYRSGATPFWACQYDKRFSYCLYVPASIDQNTPILVSVHHSFRTAESYRNRLWQFAERTGYVLLCPLFPCGIDGSDDTASYKLVYWPGIRYDLVLLAMIDEVCTRLRVYGDRFALMGFSGGGQFAHRFFYAHADRLLGVSIGAPGNVTLLDPQKPWWVGVGGLDEITDVPDLDVLRAVPVHMVVGGEDTASEGAVSQTWSPLFKEGINDSGANRVAKLEALAASFEAHGIKVQTDVVPGVAHDGYGVLGAATEFMAGVLAPLTAERRVP